MCANNGDTFITASNNVILAPNLWDRLFFVIALMYSRHTCLFHKGFCMVYFGDKERNSVILPHSAQRKHAFFGEIKQMPKKRK